MPLHPLFVHFLLVFAVLAPIAVCYAIFVTMNSEAKSRVWISILVLHFFLTVSDFVPMHFGEEDEERVEKIVSEQVIEAMKNW